MEWNQLLIWENLIIYNGIKLGRKDGLYVRGKHQSLDGIICILPKILLFLLKLL